MNEHIQKLHGCVARLNRLKALVLSNEHRPSADEIARQCQSISEDLILATNALSAPIPLVVPGTVPVEGAATVRTEADALASDDTASHGKGAKTRRSVGGVQDDH